MIFMTKLKIKPAVNLAKYHRCAVPYEGLIMRHKQSHRLIFC